MSVLVAVIGIVLPYAARLPGVSEHGWVWLTSYFGDPGYRIPGTLFIQAHNAMVWGVILWMIPRFNAMWPLIFPTVFGFGFLFWGHATLDLASDAQAAVGLFSIPLIALVPTWVGIRMGLWFDQRYGSPSPSGQA